MAASSRWSTIVVQVVLLVVVVAMATALTAKCNQTVVKAATGHETVGDDGVATMKSWGQVGDVVHEEWDEAPHTNGGIGDYVVGVAKKAKSKASEIINEVSSKAHDNCQQTQERTQGGHWSKDKANKGCGNGGTKKASESLHGAKDQGFTLKTRRDEEL